MDAVALNLDEVLEPSVEEIGAARTAARAFSALDRGAAVSLVPHGKPKVDPITIPASIFRVIVKLLAEMGNGNAVAVVPVSAELTTQQAADLLNVSRPHLIKLANDGVLPFRMVGTHRKLLARDVLNYRDKADAGRRAALAAMVVQDEELGLLDMDGAADRA